MTLALLCMRWRRGLERRFCLAYWATGLRVSFELGSRRPVLSRDVWLMTHPTLKNLSRIRAVQDWLAAALVAGKARKQQSFG